MWTYHWHWHVAHGVVTETASVGWGWYIVIGAVVAVNIALQIVLRKSR